MQARAATRIQALHRGNVSRKSAIGLVAAASAADSNHDAHDPTAPKSEGTPNDTEAGVDGAAAGNEAFIDEAAIEEVRTLTASLRAEGRNDEATEAEAMLVEMQEAWTAVQQSDTPKASSTVQIENEAATKIQALKHSCNMPFTRIRMPAMKS